MCGILGINRRTSELDLGRALKLIAHRGPDDQGQYIDDSVSLGHQRLSILDVSANGHQPMSIADENVWIVFNGEIYNHLELRKEFGLDYPYRSRTDTETILRGYLLHGKKVVEKLNGIFALAIYDRRSRELFVARDQLGIKPLYYYHADGQFAFASELKALPELCENVGPLDPKAFLNYVHYLWSPGERTPFQNVRKLLAGHHLTIQLDRPDQLEIAKYYEIPFDGTYLRGSEGDLIDELDHHLRTAVKRQLLSDVPVGFFLSGGLDSSLIVAMARRELGSGFNCYTIDSSVNGQMEGCVDDLAYAVSVADNLDVNLIKIQGHADLLKDLDRVVWHLDEPQADPACLLVWEIAKAARENGDVVLLGGAGGDDLFSGYRRHQALRMEWLFAMLSGRLGKFCKQFIHAVPFDQTVFRRLKKVSQGWGQSRLDRLAAYYRSTDLKTCRSFFRREFLGSESFDPSMELLDSLKAIPAEQTPLNQLLFWDIKFFLTDHNLNYTDKMSMAAGVEARVPFLDLDLVRFACRLPPDLKMKGWQTKYLLRKVAERYLPKDVIYRPKTGFGAPLRSWTQAGVLDNKITDLVESSGVTREILDLDRVAEFAEQTKRGRVDGAYSLLSLMSIKSWLNQFSFAPSGVS